MLENVAELYGKYDAELRGLGARLRRFYHALQRRGHRTAFSDVEGEILYLLVRESRPETVFEISPAAGWSTNYLLAALTANGAGTLHSFELAPTIDGRPTAEVIRSNQHPDSDQRRLEVHVGDAQETVPAVAGPIDLLLLDSCHEEFFARWYVDRVFPRVRGPVMVQDVAFVDGLEPSSEAQYLWAWLGEARLRVVLVGALEAELERAGVRAGYPERRGVRSNAVVFALPVLGTGGLPALGEPWEALVARAEAATSRGDAEAADRLLSEAIPRLLRATDRTNRHRALCRAGACFARLGEAGEARRCLERALGVVVLGDPGDRRKGLPELFDVFRARRQWRLALRVALLMMLEPQVGLRRAVRTALAPVLHRWGR
jgi:predicted O-methyltransferase YrrM